MNIKIRKPTKDDAKNIYNLVESTKVLDLNSEYLYLLQSTHFSDECCVATLDEKIVGFVSGYIHPKKEDVFFIWQVGVDQITRGKGLASRMIQDILKREHLNKINTVHTTISPSNNSSKRVFEKLTKELEATITSETMFEVSDFHNAHEDEVLYKIELKK